jgi:radical SAM family uncharacterized protein/radical SAM-linked protein
MNRKVCWEELLKQVEKPARYSGGEWNEVKKDPRQVRAKVALIFPDLYEVGMSYLGQKILYYLLNESQSILAERVFAPWVDFEQKLRTSGVPLCSLENRIPLDKFDLLGFSLLYELNFSNILTILDLGKIPLLSSERKLNHPLVVGGGPGAFNPEPVADVFDLFLIGDGEEGFIEIVEKYIALRRKVKEKRSLLKEMTKIKGVYVPSLYIPYQPPKSFLLAVRPGDDVPEKISKRIYFPFGEAPFPEKIVVPNTKVIFDRVAVEVARGCWQKCRFCQASSIYFPPRVKSPSFVLEKVLGSVRSTGYEDTSLASLSVSDYPYLQQVVEALMSELARQKVSLSLSSLRPKGLSPDIIKNILRVRKTGFTLVPEAGTERLRRVINKKLNNDEIFEAAKNAFLQGWRLLKLYFMIGLPTEKNEDLEGIADLVKEVVDTGFKILKRAPQINLSVSPFIPKPHTPFQWLKMEEETNLGEKYKFLKFRLKRQPAVKFKKNPLKSSVLEAVFSRGDRRLSRVLFDSWAKGARFDSWNECFDFGLWQEAFQSNDIDYNLYLTALDKESVLPWDHIDTGFKKSFLLRELDRAMNEEQTLSCLDSQCGDCQGCTLSSLVERKFGERVKISSEKHVSLGLMTQSILRYRALYSKLDIARFISHLDLSHVIQRAFRRARVPVIYSEGFHPKMVVSYAPALPLGMEGRAEVLEFRSDHFFAEKEFLTQVNSCLPPGVRFLNLKKLEPVEPSLSEGIKTMVYSLDLKSQEVKEAIQTIRKERRFSSEDDGKNIEELLGQFFADNKSEWIERIFVDRSSAKLYFYLKYCPQKGIRPQDIATKILPMKNPVFAMAREKILFSR